MSCDELEPAPIASGPPGRKGNPGAAGAAAAPGTNGKNAFTATTASFVMPATAGSVQIAVEDSEFAGVGQIVFIEGAGYFRVTGLPSAVAMIVEVLPSSGNSAAGGTIATGKRVTPGGFSVVDATALTTLNDRLTALENGTVSTAGIKTYYSAGDPTGMKAGDVWFKPVTNVGIVIFRYDGSGWVDMSATVNAPDFGLGVKPVIVVDTLPDPAELVGGVPRWTEGSVIFVKADDLIYRHTGSAWTKGVNAADVLGQLVEGQIAANAITAGKIAAGQIAASHIGANEVIAQSANIAQGIIQNGHIENLAASKITAGDIGAMNYSIAGRLYHVSHPGKYFAVVTTSFSSGNGHVFGSGTGFSFNHVAPAQLLGPGHAAFGTLPSMCPDSGNYLKVFIQGAIIGYTGNIALYYRKNDTGAYLPLLSQNVSDGGLARAIAFRQVASILPTDKVSFYVAPCDGNGDIVTPFTGRFELDVIAFNW